MREMKDSGIDWLGEVPANWSIKRLKQILQERNEKNNPIKSTNLLSLSIERGVFPYSEKTGGGNKAKEKFEDYKLTYPNDIVLNSMNVVVGAVGKSNDFGCISPVYYTLFSRNDNYNIDYYNEIFQSEAFQKSLWGLGNGIVVKESDNGKLNTIRMRIPMEKLNNVLLPIPTKAEQDRISKFLDKKITEIDNVIEKTKQTIEEYKIYKQSVIEEIFNKQEDCNLIRLKFLCDITTGDEDTQNANPDGIYPFYVRSPIVEHCDRYTFEGEGILVAGDGAGAGRIFHHVFDKYAVHQRVYILYNFKCNPTYLHYYLSTLFPYEMDKGSAQSTVPSMRLPMLQNFYIKLPTIKKQEMIVKEIEKKQKTIDLLIEQKNNILTEIQSYKKSLIYEYVTGKKEVV